MPQAANATERTAIDGLLGPPTSGWDGGARTDLDGHVAFGGLHAATADRNLLLPALWEVQDQIGHISKGAMNYICERLSVPPADAYGVASFYSLLATADRPSRVAHVCDDIACRNSGATEILDELSDRVDVHTGPCLGQCERAPAAFFQLAGQSDQVIAPATAESIRDVLDLNRLPGPTPLVGSVPQLGSDGHELTVMARVGKVDPMSLDSYVAHDGYAALSAAMQMGPQAVVAEVKKSNLRGRGGAAFPMGIKWEAVAAESAEEKYLVCNADESEPGTFKDRVLIEGDPFAIVEAMTIAGYAIGAGRGYFYIRGEYPDAQSRFENAVETARNAGLLGADINGSGFSFDIEVRRGAGAYICGEETALFNSIEGFRGEPRQKPPFPTQAGLFGKPTVINNVETLINVLAIVRGGGETFAAIGSAESTGTKVFCLSGHVRKPGVYEVEFGATLGDLLTMAGGVDGVLRAALVGGAAGSFLLEDQLDLPLTFEATRAAGASLGSGVIMSFNADTDFVDLVLRIGAFFRDESCGQCVPCRVGTMRQEESLIRLAAGSDDEVDLLADVAQVMSDSSICGFGHAASWAVQSALRSGLIGGAS
ncbi:MAG: NAD(P)H-dependent oxidoreductase subunit E [Acidimicrobiia bacterium]|nr:NAD(P)H-dependent oxidoreductase subunit E [Acidimicrobiia bacterium]MDX2468031.1 NAD(P)H-dependent oxidoreductase subunit E [Acidimicrobiia bacterium]